MTEKLSYDDFKAKYLANIPQETIAQLEKMHNMNDLEQIIEQEFQIAYNDYLKGYEKNDTQSNK